MTDAVVVRYTDGREDLITENEFSALVNRRRQDNIWSTIQFIKNYIPVRKDTADWVTVRYDEKVVMYSFLKQRAQRLIKVYAKKITLDDDQYISELEEVMFVEELLQQERVVLASYLTYKLVEFIQYFHDTTVVRANFVWKVDLLGHAVLEDVLKLKYQDQVRFEWTENTIQARTAQQEFMTFYSKTLPSLNPQQLEAAQQLQELMNGHYEQTKEQLGLKQEPPRNTQDEENNAFFRKMHP
jgi:hypothetical protein